MRTALFLIFISFNFTNCNNKDASINDLETKGYIYESIKGSDTQIVKLKDAEGNITESGMMLNGHKMGVWTFNHPSTNFPMKLISFVDDIQNGPYFELNDRGQTTVMAYYKNNILHGPWAKFRYGSAEMSVNYVEGKRHGIYRELDFKNGKITKEISYKNDKENGFMRFYDPDGNITVEYEYKDGEKIGGGIID